MYVPRHPCGWPGCGAITVRYYCDKHQCQAKAKPDHRQSPSKRGYGRKHQRLRATFLQQHPICEIKERCEGAPATELDHIDPDGLRFNESNLQAACKRCHSWKGYNEDKRGIARYARSEDTTRGRGLL